MIQPINSMKNKATAVINFQRNHDGDKWKVNPHCMCCKSLKENIAEHWIQPTMVNHTNKILTSDLNSDKVDTACAWLQILEPLESDYGMPGKTYYWNPQTLQRWPIQIHDVHKMKLDQKQL